MLYSEGRRGQGRPSLLSVATHRMRKPITHVTSGASMDCGTRLTTGVFICKGAWAAALGSGPDRGQLLAASQYPEPSRATVFLATWG